MYLLDICSFVISLASHQEGRSALSLAADESRVDVMNVLIQRGADLNTQDRVRIYYL